MEDEQKSEEAPASQYEARARELQEQEDEQKSEEGRRKLLELSNLLADATFGPSAGRTARRSRWRSMAASLSCTGNSYPGYSIRVNDSPISFDGPNGAKPTVEFWDGRTITWSVTARGTGSAIQYRGAGTSTRRRPRWRRRRRRRSAGMEDLRTRAESIDDFLARAPTLDEIFARGIAAGLFTENSKQLKMMRENIDAGKFSRSTTARCGPSGSASTTGGRRAASGFPLVNSTGLAEKVAPPIEPGACPSTHHANVRAVLHARGVRRIRQRRLLSFDYQATAAPGPRLRAEPRMGARRGRGAELPARGGARMHHTEMEEFDEPQDGEMIFMAMFFGCMEALGIRGVVDQPNGSTKLTVILGIWFLLVLLIPALYYLFTSTPQSGETARIRTTRRTRRPGTSHYDDHCKKIRCSSQPLAGTMAIPAFKCRP